MTSLRKRKKWLIRAGLVGGALLGIPLSIIMLYIFRTCSERQEREEKSVSKVTVCLLARKLLPGEELKEQDIYRKEMEEGSCYMEEISVNNLIGKAARISLEKDTLLLKEFFYDADKPSEDLRLHQVTWISYTEKLKTGDYVDIRISFPNGADFVVLSKKKILDLSPKKQMSETNQEAKSGLESVESSLWFELNEEELLRLSSAGFDILNQKGTYLYAIQYTDFQQEAARINYPVNEVVEKILKEDPNILILLQDTETFELRYLVENFESSLLNEEENSLESDEIRDDNTGDEVMEEQNVNSEYLYFD
ncbi:CpaB family protein [Anaeromicropila populeti]|uniref:SAF domain-containing protein n=1 Tax=Anaeromicropila populeti TaxID=37658 RepID=A0A1I6I7P0_9FIRM|nr:hypothetical protein [Anaeromicropila populeti]SFR62723.1 hypothetical protein SAMN05661086_00517 [Anaeromicropila populeti]